MNPNAPLPAWSADARCAARCVAPRPLGLVLALAMAPGLAVAATRAALPDNVAVPAWNPCRTGNSRPLAVDQPHHLRLGCVDRRVGPGSDAARRAGQGARHRPAVGHLP